MNMKQVEGFCYLAQSLSFSKAAEQLYISQPAFSRLIDNLEKELGCKLFVRSKTNPHLTYAGEQIYARMQQIHNLTIDIHGIARLAKEEQLGFFRIGILDNGLDSCCRDLVRTYHQLYPDTTLLIKEFSEMEIINMLDTQFIDVAFLMHFPATFRSNAEGIILQNLRECAVLSDSHPLASRTSISIAELREDPFILMRGTSSQMGNQQVLGFCLQSGFSPKVVMEADSISSALSAVDCNLGVTIFSDNMKEFAGAHTVFVPLSEGRTAEHWMIWKKDVLPENIFVSRLKDIASSIKEGKSPR